MRVVVHHKNKWTTIIGLTVWLLFLVVSITADSHALSGDASDNQFPFECAHRHPKLRKSIAEAQRHCGAGSGSHASIVSAASSTAYAYMDNGNSTTPFLKQQQQQRQRTEERDGKADAKKNKENATHFAPLRIRVDVSHLYDADMHCTNAGERRGDFLGKPDVVCDAADVLTEAKRDFLVKHVLPRVVHQLERMFSVPRQGPRSSGDATTKSKSKSADADQDRLFVPPHICGPHVRIPVTHTVSGVRGADLVLYALAGPIDVGDNRRGDNHTAAAAAATTPPPRVIAWSGHCGVDGLGRPVVGRVNFSPRYIVPSGLSAGGLMDPQRATALEGDPLAWWTDMYMRAVMHEVLHTLGFVNAFLDGQSSSTKMKKGRDDVDKVTWVTSKSVVDTARLYFSCPKLEGLPLEDDGATGTAGAHWERRFLHDDIMAGALSAAAAVSPMTLAFFDSLPFYQVNMGFAEQDRMTWGAKAGCEFFDMACEPLSPQQAWSPAPRNTTTRMQYLASQYWCVDPRATETPSYMHNGSSIAPLLNFEYISKTLSTATLQQCSQDRRSVVPSCNAVRDVSSGHLVGKSLFMGGCPIAETPLTLGGTCSAMHLLEENTGSTKDADSFYYGPESRCVHVLRIKRSAKQESNTVSGDVYGVSARCARVRCVYGARVEVQVGNNWISCPDSGEAGLVWIDYATEGSERRAIVCEDARMLCTPELYVEPIVLSSLSPMQQKEKNKNKNKKKASRGRSTAQTFQQKSITPPLREFVVAITLALASNDAADWSSILDTGDFAIAVESDLAALSGVPLGERYPRQACQARLVPPFVAVVVVDDENGNNNATVPSVVVSMNLALVAETADAAVDQCLRRHILRPLLGRARGAATWPRVGALLSRLASCGGAQTSFYCPPWLLTSNSTLLEQQQRQQQHDSALSVVVVRSSGIGINMHPDDLAPVLDGAGGSASINIVGAADMVLKLVAFVASPKSQGRTYTGAAWLTTADNARMLSVSLRDDLSQMLGCTPNLLSIRRLSVVKDSMEPWHTDGALLTAHVTAYLPPTPTGSDTSSLSAAASGTRQSWSRALANAVGDSVPLNYASAALRQIFSLRHSETLPPSSAFIRLNDFSVVPASPIERSETSLYEGGAASEGAAWVEDDNYDDVYDDEEGGVNRRHGNEGLYCFSISADDSSEGTYCVRLYRVMYVLALLTALLLAAAAAAGVLCIDQQPRSV